MAKNKDHGPLGVFLRGVLMGLCDIIPGISGGTIAFITGVYHRLISSVKYLYDEVHIILRIIFGISHKHLSRRERRHIIADIQFLLYLFLGVVIAILAGAKVMNYLLAEYYLITMCFLIGLVLSSAYLIYDRIEKHTFGNLWFLVYGMLIGFSFSFFVPTSLEPSLLYLFVSGFIAISAMFLPGISGAFILLVMGVYEYIIGLLDSFIENIGNIAIFALGAVLGGLAISKVIHYLFEKDKSKTLYFLVGLVIGSLTVPVKKIYAIDAGLWDLVIGAGFMIIGMLVVMKINGLSMRKREV